MLRKRENSWFPVALVAVLLVLLVVLAGLQYTWLGQISEAERSRLRERLADDTKRFAEDFNREIQAAYFGFQTSAGSFVKDETNEFSKAHEYWVRNSNYKDIVGEIFFYKNEPDPELLRYDPAARQFKSSGWSPEITKIRKEIGDGKVLEPVISDPLALTLPVFAEPEDVQHVVIRAKRLIHSDESPVAAEPDMPPKHGFLVMLLDREAIVGGLLPDLANKYFASSTGAGYSLKVSDAAGNAVYSHGVAEVISPDSTAAMFDLRPKAFSFIGIRSPAGERTDGGKEKGVVISETFESRNVTSTKSSGSATPGESGRTVDVRVEDAGTRAVTVFESASKSGGGFWTLNVQHQAGSLDQFVANTRNRNLAISFGILGLLAVSVVLIFVSSQRAKRLAKNQLEFVSAVSHEFRTPLAVIYSAAENLSDGVIEDREKIGSYGSLIKREGRKLSAMVEQVLEFAGARSGGRRYDFGEVDARDAVRQALEDCGHQIEESGFEVETDLAEEVPKVRADQDALSQAVRNLVNNALKYANGTRWIKVAVSNGEGLVRISVEDRGIGISPEDRKHLFEPFFRSKRVVDDQISGNGLGLSIVKQIVDAHGGRIEVESEPGKGSRFEITLSGVNDH